MVIAGYSAASAPGPSLKLAAAPFQSLVEGHVQFRREHLTATALSSRASATLHNSATTPCVSTTKMTTAAPYFVHPPTHTSKETLSTPAATASGSTRPSVSRPLTHCRTHKLYTIIRSQLQVCAQRFSV
ncbi:hypothetical protein OH77DRAFT_340282 [Trametes cingulata]|nr:hypothetical protein OH77DRAFT_340282 [Trametes cingulata]